jgi:hypothetical protein
MTVDTFDRLAAVYECSENTRYMVVPVAFNGLKAYGVLVKQLLTLLGEAQEDEYWDPLVRQLRYFSFDICSTPLPEEYLQERVANLLNGLATVQKTVRHIHPEAAPVISAVTEQLRKLATHRLDTLLTATAEAVAGNKQANTALLVKQARLLPIVEKVVRDTRALKHCLVTALPDLRTATCFDRLLVFGLPYWYPDYVFSAPRATEVAVIKFNWLRGVWKYQPAFPAQAKFAKAPRPRPQMTDVASGSTDLDLEDIMPSLDLASIAAKARKEVEKTGSEEYVDARTYGLEDDWYVFLEADDSARQLIIDMDGSAEKRVRRVAHRELEVGMFLLLRKSGGGDYLVPVANQVLGNKSTYVRERQRNWKNLLRKVVRQRGMRWTVVELERLGCSIANGTNVRRWMWERSIGTHSYSDFVAIMRLIGLEARASEYWNAMRDIRRAHYQAGFVVSSALMQQAGKSDLRELSRKGMMEFELPDQDAGSLVAFRIKSISREPTRAIPSWIGVPMDPE